MATKISTHRKRITSVGASMTRVSSSAFTAIAVARRPPALYVLCRGRDERHLESGLNCTQCSFANAVPRM